MILTLTVSINDSCLSAFQSFVMNNVNVFTEVISLRIVRPPVRVIVRRVASCHASTAINPSVVEQRTCYFGWDGRCFYYTRSIFYKGHCTVKLSLEDSIFPLGQIFVGDVIPWHNMVRYIRLWLCFVHRVGRGRLDINFGILAFLIGLRGAAVWSVGVGVGVGRPHGMMMDAAQAAGSHPSRVHL